MSEDQPFFVTLPEFCERTRMRRSSVYNCIARGMPARKIGTLLRIPLQEALDWMNGHPQAIITPAMKRGARPKEPAAA